MTLAQVPHRVGFDPVRDADQGPLWSVMIPTHECAGYLRAALTSVLAQDPGPGLMQIEVVDDASTDDPEAVVAELAGRRVGFFRQPSNVGHIRNFDTCIQRSRGRLVHLLHGDDAVREGFYERMAKPFASHPEIGAAFCRHIIMDEQGHWRWISKVEEPRSGVLPNWLERIATGQRLQAPAMVVRRAVYEHMGGFDQRIRHYGEDWEMWVRIAAHYPVWYEAEPLAVYRIRTTSLSGRTLRTGENGADLRRAIEINREWLPAERTDALTAEALRNNALACVRRAYRLANSGEMQASFAQLRESVRFTRSLRVVALAAGVFGYRLARMLPPFRPRP